MKDDIVPDDHSRINANSRIKDAVLANLAVVPDIDILVDDCIVPDHGMVSDKGEGSEIYSLSEFRRQEPSCPQTAVAAGLFLLVGNIFQKLSDGIVGIVHPYHCRSHRFLGHEILADQQDGCFAGIDVRLVFGVGKETQCSRFAVFDLCEFGCYCVFISVHSAAEYVCKLFCC